MLFVRNGSVIKEMHSPFKKKKKRNPPHKRQTVYIYPNETILMALKTNKSVKHSQKNNKSNKLGGYYKVGSGFPSRKWAMSERALLGW